MQKSNNDCCQNRRKFISSILPICAFSCLGTKNSFSSILIKDNQNDVSFKEKINKKFCKTYEEAWKFRYEHYIYMMEYFAKELGRDKVIKILKKENDSILIEDTSDKAENTFEKFIEKVKFKVNNSYKNLLSVQFLEATDEVFEYRVTDCLWAKTFKEQNAGDLGYATICYGDFPKATYYNPKMKLRLTKTLMQRDECCNHRYTWQDK